MILNKKGLFNYLKLFKNFKPNFLFSFANKELYFKANNNWLFKGLIGKQMSLDSLKENLPKNNPEGHNLPLEEMEQIYTIHESFIITKKTFYFIKNKKLICELQKNMIRQINHFSQKIELDITIKSSFDLKRKVYSYGSYKFIKKLTFDFVNNNYYANEYKVTEKMFFRLIKEFKKTNGHFLYYSPTKKRYFSVGAINQYYSIPDKKIITTESFDTYFFRENFCIQNKIFYYLEWKDNVIIDKFEIFDALENKLKINFFSYYVKEKIFNYATKETYFLLSRTKESVKFDETNKYVLIDFNKKMYAVLTEEKLDKLEKTKAKGLFIKKTLLKWRLENG